MKPDMDYLKNLLQTCEDHPEPTFTITDLEAAGIDYEAPDFLFHMRILKDQGFLESASGQEGFGYYESLDGMGYWAELPLRLTARGHEFIQSLRQAEVWEVIKRDFKDQAISAVFEVAKGLAIGFAKKKAQEYLSEDS